MSTRRRAAAAAGTAAVGGVGLAVYAGQYPTAQIYGETIHRERRAGKRIALTYDDGPNPEQTPRLLELLARYDAKATFFLIGGWAEREPALIRQTVAAGHAIGNHTFSHPTMPAHRDATIRRELHLTSAAIEDAGVELSRVGGHRLMRPPYGRRRPGTLRVLREEGYIPVFWSITLWDWKAKATADRIVDSVERRGRGGDVLLLHDGSDEAIGADRRQSIEATDRILRRWQGERGFRFVTIPEMIEGAK
jgi:peptidoglycan/xylan/chitin deacetylase (PgdA/CDA1 family)